ncbi:hypothetical protein JCM10450v2_000667 [Rhodotorula kratochvilovae]
MVLYAEFVDAVDALIVVFRTLGLASREVRQVDQWAEELRNDETWPKWHQRTHEAQQTVLGNLAAARNLAYRGELLVIGAILDDVPLDIKGDYDHFVLVRFDIQPRAPPRNIQSSAPYESFQEAVERVVALLHRDAAPGCHHAIEEWQRALLEEELPPKEWRLRHVEHRIATNDNLARVLDWIRAGATELPDAEWIAYASVPAVPHAGAEGPARTPLQPADMVKALNPGLEDERRKRAAPPMERHQIKELRAATSVARFRVAPTPGRGLAGDRRASSHAERPASSGFAAQPPAESLASEFAASFTPAFDAGVVYPHFEHPGEEHFIFVPDPELAFEVPPMQPEGTPAWQDWPERRKGP